MELKLDLTISGGKLALCSREIEPDELEWGSGNRAQGVMWLPGLVVLDALADDEFSADVIVRHAAKFLPNRQAKRALRIPFSITDTETLSLLSPVDEEPLPLELPVGDYTLVYEVCLGREVYYILTLLDGTPAEACSLKDDGWGLGKDQALPAGRF